MFVCYIYHFSHVMCPAVAIVAAFLSLEFHLYALTNQRGPLLNMMFSVSPLPHPVWTY